MTSTFDLVIADDGGDSDRDDSEARAARQVGAAGVAARRALERGLRVFVVIRSADGGRRRLLRQYARSAITAGGQLSIVSNAEVVCVDGVDRVEAVVIRHRTTGRLRALNASAFVRCS